jgi:hypothetical protein
VHKVEPAAKEARGAHETHEKLRSITGVTAKSPPGKNSIS